MKKRVVSIALAAVMSVALLSGCGGDRDAGKKKVVYEPDPIVNEPGKFPISKDKDVTIRIGIAQSTSVTDYVDNTFTKALEEKMGCKLEFELLPTQDTKQKVELMIASGGEDLPDVLLMNFTDNELAAYGKNGTFLDLAPYFENSAYYLNDMFEYEKETYGTDLKRLITLSDGSMYYVPKYNKALQNEYGCRMWVYEPWLEKLGLEKPTTLEEYKEMLIAFRDKDPNGNGKKDEIPASGYNGDQFVEFIMGSFMPIQPWKDFYVDSKDKVHARFMEDAWRDGLRYMNDLFNEGLITDVMFTQTNTDLSKLNSQKDMLVGTQVSMAPSVAADLRASRLPEFTHIAPLKNDKTGEGYAAWHPSAPECAMVITKNCKHPELAFRLGDLMCEPTLTIWNRWGEEGVDWEKPAEGAKSLFDHMGYPPTITPTNLVWGQPSNHHWQNIGPGYRDYAVSLGQTASGSTNVSEELIAKACEDYQAAKYDKLIIKYLYDIEDFQDIATYKSNIEPYVKEQTALFITGNKDIEKDWDAYIKHLKSIGADKYLEINQKAYDKYLK